MQAEQAEGKSNSTIRRDLAALSTVFSYAQELLTGAPMHNPVIALRKRHLKENKRERYLTRREVDHLISHTTDPVHAALIELAVQTGMRLGEMLNLEWSEVHLDRRVIIIPGHRTKTGKPRGIPLSDTAQDTLRRLERSEDTPNVFVVRDWQGNVRPMRHIQRWWYGTLKRAGIEDLRFHDLRHTFASWWRQRSGNDPALREILGHTSPGMTDRYAHLDTEHLLEAMNRMGLIAEDTNGTQHPH